ncbi:MULTISPECIES: TadE/TadG family type IV pilus assembly protein [Bradyrhizobium]|uniref:Pilus assembly protein n=1 Tax=Bradyrhizobium brasilense TaxID=1419277 RepID=A0ABY8JCZ6_9BRAD|nr:MULTISPECIES: TadE/TadG family type IV pilus assembly protein [Bradyrhizobium]MCC8947010.1 pilus assembly protein [Bradyrhizobium brasilense]MCP3417455.1 pilus assembly protein [Bradyrhizobium brasilense]OMI14563.1 pilus assembly protein TadG [Bradyrhizobium brasilense]WFU63440.1 pilus assembly protein [Bradyrhizobium brasilense]
MPLPAHSFTRLLHRFRRNRRGATAVEFAMVAPLFFGLLFAIIEVAMIFFASQVLETVTQDSARMIMTGQAQGASYTQQQFKDYVCGQVNPLFDCANGISVDVRSYPAATGFSSVNIAPPIDSNNAFIPAMKWCPGKDGDVVVVRLFYQWPLFVTKLGFNVANLANGKRLLTATATFKNEPSGTAGATCS